MPIKKGREYRALQDFSLIPREGENDAYRVRGTAVVFDSPTCLYEYDGVKYYEVIDRHAFDGCDMSDVIMNYNHGGKVVARLRNKSSEPQYHRPRRRYGGRSLRHRRGPRTLRGDRRPAISTK